MLAPICRADVSQISSDISRLKSAKLVTRDFNTQGRRRRFAEETGHIRRRSMTDQARMPPPPRWLPV